MPLAHTHYQTTAPPLLSPLYLKHLMYVSNLTSGQVLNIFLHQLSSCDIQSEPIFA